MHEKPVLSFLYVDPFENQFLLKGPSTLWMGINEMWKEKQAQAYSLHVHIEI